VVNDDYADLKRLVADQGLLERHPRTYIGPAARLVAMLGAVTAGIILTRDSWWVLFWSVPAALLFGQIGFLAHEAAHNQIMKTSGANYVLSVLLFNLSLGGSRGWWADKHNLHHSQPNRLGVDPDIDGGPIATSVGEAVQARGVARVIMRWQAGAIWPLLCLGVLQIQVYSAAFIFNRRVRNASFESALFLAHGIVYFGGLVLILGPVRGLLFALAHQMLLGAYLGGAFLPNHLGMRMLDGGESMDFLHRQVLTARNLREGRVTDYVFGALACQVEHHLFPAMPRCNLRAAAVIVRRFCRDRDIPYHETSVLTAFAEVHRHLSMVVAPLRRRIA
jgi:fatty acid desaturase